MISPFDHRVILMMADCETDDDSDSDDALYLFILFNEDLHGRWLVHSCEIDQKCDLA